ncbi:MAG: YfhO family protein [Candidatus Levybacteria bacterium]|nr:YfhO family protein [Candidatus Levybacteria bacterium]
MRWKELIFVFVLFLLIGGIFFYKNIAYGYVPFPGDLLIAEYSPWKTYSYLGYNPGSFPNKAQYFDTLRQLYPWKTFSLNQLKIGQIPLWNPYNFSGAPLLANFQSAVFYPLNFIYLLTGKLSAWTLLVMFQPLLAGLFTYMYARKIKLENLGAIFAASSFAFSLFMSVWLEYNTIGQVILWLPLTLLAIEKLLEKRQIKWMVIFVFSIASSLLAGHIQIFVYLFGFSIIYFIFRSRILAKENFNQQLVWFGCLSILSLGLGAVQLIPGIELITQAARSPHQYDFLVNKILIQPYQLIMFFVPDFFGNPATRNYWLLDTYVGKVTSIGITAIIFILFGIFSQKNPFKKFFLWTALIVLILVTNNPITALLYKVNLPLISGSAPTLAVFLFCFAASILAGFGIDFLEKENIRLKKYFYFVLPVILFFLLLYVVTLFLQRTNAYGLGSQLQISLRNLSYSMALIIISAVLLLIAVLSKKIRYLILIILLLINVFDLWRSFEKFNPFSPKELVFPNAQVLNFLQQKAGINRFWGYQAGNIEANFATEYRLFSPQGYDPLYPKRYGEFIQAAANGRIVTDFTNQTRSDANIPQTGNLGTSPYRLKILDLLGVKYVLDRMENASTQNDFPADRFNLAYEQNGWKIFENIKVLPRVFLVSDYKTFNNKEEFEKLFFAKSFDLSKTIILEENLKKTLSYPNKQEVLNIVSYTPNEININIETDANRLLFLSDTYYPGWKAYVDGKETAIYRSDYAFRSIYVPNGDHKIKFVFIPNSFKLGYIISLLSVFCLIVFLALFVKRRPHGI